MLVNYRSAGTIRALAGMLDRDHLTLFVVNNDPGELLARAGTWPAGARFIENRENRGFAAAVNQAARLGSSPWILLMNPDVRVEPAVLDRVPAILDTIPPGVAVIGGVNREPGGPRTHGSLPSILDPLTTPALPAREEVWEADWAAGSFVLLRREPFERLGGFDESYFMYFEDVDYGRRLKQAGYTVRIDPRLAHHHPGHGSYGGDAGRQAADYRRSKALYLARHGHWLHHRLYRAFRSPPGRLEP